MSDFILKFQSELGQSVSIRPTSFAPLSFSQLLQAKHFAGAGIDVKFRGIDAVIDGVPQDEITVTTAKMVFPNSPEPYALVVGGWLPLPFVIPKNFLVDRNVVAKLRRIRARGPRRDDVNFQWWRQFIDGTAVTFNPLLYAYEGGSRCLPTMDEFVAAYREGAQELRSAFPAAQIIDFEREHFESAYSQLVMLRSRGERDAEFLCHAVPFINQRVPRGQERRILDALMKIAGDGAVFQNSLVGLAVLSVLYEDVHGKRPSIGRRLLKPKAKFTVEDAYNALSDLRHIEIAALSHAVIPDQKFALCTNDVGVAMFWCALSVRGQQEEGALLNIHYSLNENLVPRLHYEEIGELLDILGR